MGEEQEPRDKSLPEEEMDPTEMWDDPTSLTIQEDRTPLLSKTLVIGDMYIFLLDPSKSPRTLPFLAKLVELKREDQTAHFEDSEGEIIVFAYDINDSETEQDHFTLTDKTPGYEILDKALVTPFTLPLSQEGEMIDITPESNEEYEISTQSKRTQEYSTEIKQDDLLFNYIRALNIYDQPHLIEEAHRRISDLVAMVENPKPMNQNSIIQKSLPSCLIPIIDSEPKKYEEDEFPYQMDVESKQVSSTSLNYNQLLQLILEPLTNFPNEEGLGYSSQDYVGPFLRDCIQNDTCTSIDGDSYAYDSRRAPSAIAIPLFKKDEKGNDITEFVEAYPPQKLKINGLLEEPYAKSYYGLKESSSRKISLRERIILHSEYDHDKLNLSHMMKSTQIIGHISGPDTLREINGDHFISHRFEQNLTEQTYKQTLENNVSRPTDIIENLRDAEILSTIQNIKDIEKYLVKYSLCYSNLTKEARTMIDQIIHRNLSSSKRVTVELEDSYDKIKKMSVGLKIKEAKDYILSIQDIKRKSDLLQEFIKVYCRESDKSYEDPNYFYNKYANEALLCKHYQYIARISNENSVFDTMKSIYGTAPIDGKICCKVCGEALCDEDASLHEGFVDDVAIVSRDILETAEDAAKREFVDMNSRDETRLSMISSSLGVDLTLDMIYDLLKIVKRSDPNEVTMKRYQHSGSQHPRISLELDKIKSEEATLKKSKTKEAKKALKRLREKKEEISTSFKRWLVDTNRFLLMVGGLALVIQTAVPALNLKHNEEFRVIDSKSGGFRENTLRYLEIKMKRICQSYLKDPFWKSARAIFDEPQGVPDFMIQLQKVILYLIDGGCPEIMKRIKLYDEFSEYERGLFLRPEWALFSPHSRNLLNRSVNECVSSALLPETLKRVIRGYLVENISLIRSIQDPIESVAHMCDIPTLEIVQNPAFLKLFRLSVACYGTQPNNVLVSILIHQLLATSSQKEAIQAILSKHGWKSQSGGFPTLDFRVWRTKIIPDILELSSKEGSTQIESCATNESSCNSFIHRSINNFDYHMLATFPKRHYSYKTLQVFPSSSFSELAKENPNILKKLFSLYKINKINQIVRHDNHDDPLNQYFAAMDIDSSENTDTIQREPLQSLSQDEATFQEILAFKRDQGSLTYIPTLSKKDKYSKEDYQLIDQIALVGDSRLLRFLKHIPDTDESKDINDRVCAILKDKKSKVREINETFSQYITLQSSNIEVIAQFIIQSENIDEERRNRLKKLLGVKFTQDSLVKILDQYLKDLDPHRIVGEIQDIKRILAILSEEKFSLQSPFCPKEWKQNDSEKEKISKQLQRTLYDEAETTVPSESMLHDEILKPVKRRYQAGFESYRMIDDSSHLYFEGLSRYLKPYLDNLYLLIGDNRSIYSPKLAKIYSRYHMSNIFAQFINYLSELKDSESEIAEDANILYAGLDQDRYESLQRSLQMISTFIIDLLTHLLMSHYDPQWIYQNKGKTLDKRLAKQREREKGERIKALDQASGSSEREIMTAKQNAGLTNWFLEASQAAEKYTNSDDYRNATEEERRTTMIAIFGSKGIEIQDIPDLPIPNVSDEADPNDDERDGYDYRDAMDLENDDLAADEDLNDDYDQAVEAVFNE